MCLLLNARLLQCKKTQPRNGVFSYFRENERLRHNIKLNFKKKKKQTKTYKDEIAKKKKK